MEYEVINPDGINNVEFGITAEPGIIFSADEVEPDLLQNWLIYGHVAPVAAADEDDLAPEPEGFDDDEPESED